MLLHRLASRKVAELTDNGDGDPAANVQVAAAADIFRACGQSKHHDQSVVNSDSWRIMIPIPREF